MEEEMKKQQKSAIECEEEQKEQPIDDQKIGDIVGGRDPFTTLPKIGNQPIDDYVAENG